jgi:HNH endonuclease
MHIDHIYPESKGGKNCISNYVLSCQNINFIKNDRVYDSLIRVSIEVVDAMFSEKVVNIYNDLVSNKSIIDGYVELNEYLNELNFDSHALIGVFRSYVCSVLIPIRIYPIWFRN